MFGSLAGLAGPAINSLMSRQVPDDAQGELQGAINATNSLAAILGPLLATQLFRFFTQAEKDAPGYFPGAPFLGAGILVLARRGGVRLHGPPLRPDAPAERRQGAARARDGPARPAADAAARGDDPTRDRAPRSSKLKPPDPLQPARRDIGQRRNRLPLRGVHFSSCATSGSAGSAMNRYCRS